MLAERLVQEIDKTRSVDSSGKVSFTGWAFGVVGSVLTDLVTFNAAVAEIEKTRMIRNAVFEAAVNPLSLESILQRASALERLYLRKPEERLVVVTQVSLSRWDELHGVRRGNVSISFPNRLPETFLRTRAEAVTRAQDSLHAPYPRDYRWVRVSVRARSAPAAVDQALEALGLTLGLWNLSLNAWSNRMTFGKRKPVNDIGLAPVHSVHDHRGRTSGDEYWYEPDYVGSLEVKPLRQKAAAMLKTSAGLRTRLGQVAYRDKLENVIRSYNRALDSADWSTSFIRLWQTLEMATNSVNEPNTVAVKRASFIYREHEHDKAILDYLRTWRNRIVHAGADSESMESKLYALKTYVENLIFFHLRTGSQFESFGEATEFLDLPASEKSLVRRRTLASKALDMRRAF